MQPRALTIKKKKIKCIPLEFPLGLKGKSVNFSQLLSFGIFISFFTAVGAGLRRVEKSHLFLRPQHFVLRLGGAAGQPAHLWSPSLPGHSGRNLGAQTSPVVKLAHEAP